MPPDRTSTAFIRQKVAKEARRRKRLRLVPCVVSVCHGQNSVRCVSGGFVETTPPPLPVASRSFLEFRGSGREYFGIWIVNLVLSIITLGIYIPWARVRTRRYFYRNTLLDGHSFDYLADPKRLLIGYLIIGAFFISYSIAGNIDPFVALRRRRVLRRRLPLALLQVRCAFSRPTPPTAISASASTAPSEAPTPPILAGRSSPSPPSACLALWPSSSKTNTSLTISPSAHSAPNSADAPASFLASSTPSASRSSFSLVSSSPASQSWPR